VPQAQDDLWGLAVSDFSKTVEKTVALLEHEATLYRKRGDANGILGNPWDAKAREYRDLAASLRSGLAAHEAKVREEERGRVVAAADRIVQERLDLILAGLGAEWDANCEALVDSIRALRTPPASPLPEPVAATEAEEERVCECKHAEADHSPGGRFCLARTRRNGSLCGCDSFRLAPIPPPPDAGKCGARCTDHGATHVCTRPAGHDKAIGHTDGHGQWGDESRDRPPPDAGGRRM
jgi:hypothetical protein